jgi:hypothetical protein
LRAFVGYELRVSFSKFEKPLPEARSHQKEFTFSFSECEKSLSDDLFSLKAENAFRLCKSRRMLSPSPSQQKEFTFVCRVR